LKNLFLKKDRETIFDILGKFIIASLRTFRLGSSPIDKIYKPMNCSFKSLPKSSAILLNSYFNKKFVLALRLHDFIHCYHHEPFK
jgi:hypothetical protein